MKKVYEFLGKEYDLEEVNEKVNEAIDSLNELNANWTNQVREAMKKVVAENKDYEKEELDPMIVDFQEKHKKFIEAKKAQVTLRQKSMVEGKNYDQLLKDVAESVELATALSTELEKMLALLDNPQIPAKVKMNQLELQLDTFAFSETTLKTQKEFNNTYYFDNMFEDDIDDENDFE